MRKLILLILALCLLLVGCGKDEIPTEDVELWVVTELSHQYGLNDQANLLIGQFQEIYPNVTIRMDILPTGNEERAVYLEKLRTKIMGGAGPDVYLMPTENFVPDPASVHGNYMRVEPLFRDVSAAMYNCLFYDISEFYDADEALKAQELSESVMNAGVMEGCRYVLPLRYDFELLLVDRENLEEAGMDADLFEKSANEIISAALEMGNGSLARAGLTTNSCYCFSETVDRQSGRVLLTAEEVAEYMRLYQAALALPGGEGGSSKSANNYIYDGSFFASDGITAVRTNMSLSMSAMSVAKVLGRNMDMYPYLAPDGTLKADICYYAAVGSGTDYPRLAYEFARMFLLDEAQFESYLMSGRYKKNIVEHACDGWPVRTVGSVGERFRLLQYNIENRQYNRNEKRIGQFLREGFTITNADVPAASWQVDEARFPIIMEPEDDLYYYLLLLNDYENDCAPTDADIDTLAQEYIRKMQLYLDEG